MGSTGWRRCRRWTQFGERVEPRTTTRSISALNGLTLGGLLFCTGTAIIGGATWALAANRAHTQGVTWGRFMVIGGFLGAVVIGAAVAIINTGFSLGS